MGLDYSAKAQSLADKMNKLSQNFDLAEEMVIEADDIVGYVKEKTSALETVDVDNETGLIAEEILTASEIINLSILVEDFKYIREVLKETADNGRRVLNSVTLDLLDSDDEKRASLIISFAELNRAVCDNMKLYIQSYKEISTVLLNLDKIKKNDKNSGDAKNINTVGTVNNVTINTSEQISTADLIKQLKLKDINK